MTEKLLELLVVLKCTVSVCKGPKLHGEFILPLCHLKLNVISSILDFHSIFSTHICLKMKFYINIILLIFTKQRVAVNPISSTAVMVPCVSRTAGNVMETSTAEIIATRKTVMLSLTGKENILCAPVLTSPVHLKTSVSTSHGSVTEIKIV